MTDITLTEAIAEVKRIYSDVRGLEVTYDLGCTILNAVASGELIPVQCCMCGKKDLSVVEGDGGQECELADGRWTCSSDCWEKATDNLIPLADHKLAVALAYQRAATEADARYAAGDMGNPGHHILALADQDDLAEVQALKGPKK